MKFRAESGVDNMEHKPPVVCVGPRAPIQLFDTPLDIAMHFGIGNFHHGLLKNTTLQVPVDKALDVEWQSIVPAQKIELLGDGRHG